MTILTDRGVHVPPLSKSKWLKSEAAKQLDLTPESHDGEVEKGTREVLSGLSSLVSGVATLRKSQGIGPHGRDALERILSTEYALVIARAVDAAVGLMVRLHQEQLGRSPLSSFRFEANPDFNEHLDTKYAELVIEEAPIPASSALYQQDRAAYRKSLVEFRAQPEIEEEPISEGEALLEDTDG